MSFFSSKKKREETTGGFSSQGKSYIVKPSGEIVSGGKPSIVGGKISPLYDPFTPAGKPGSNVKDLPANNSGLRPGISGGGGSKNKSEPTPTPTTQYEQPIGPEKPAIILPQQKPDPLRLGNLPGKTTIQQQPKARALDIPNQSKEPPQKKVYVVEQAEKRTFLQEQRAKGGVYAFAGGFAETIGGTAKTLLKLAFNPAETGKDIVVGTYQTGKKALTTGFPEVSQQIREEPSRVFGIVGGNLATAYAPKGVSFLIKPKLATGFVTMPTKVTKGADGLTRVEAITIAETKATGAFRQKNYVSAFKSNTITKQTGNMIEAESLGSGKIAEQSKTLFGFPKGYKAPKKIAGGSIGEAKKADEMIIPASKNAGMGFEDSFVYQSASQSVVEGGKPITSVSKGYGLSIDADKSFIVGGSRQVKTNSFGEMSLNTPGKQIGLAKKTPTGKDYFAMPKDEFVKSFGSPGKAKQVQDLIGQQAVQNIETGIRQGIKPARTLPPVTAKTQTKNELLPRQEVKTDNQVFDTRQKTNLDFVTLSGETQKPKQIIKAPGFSSGRDGSVTETINPVGEKFNFIPVQIQPPIPKPGIRGKYKIPPQIQKPSFANPTPPININPIPVMPPFTFDSPKGYGGKAFNSLAGGKSKIDYTPSLAGFSLGFKKQVTPKQFEKLRKTKFSGVEIRPVVSVRRRGKFNNPMRNLRRLFG